MVGVYLVENFVHSGMGNTLRFGCHVPLLCLVCNLGIRNACLSLSVLSSAVSKNVWIGATGQYLVPVLAIKTVSPSRCWSTLECGREICIRSGSQAMCCNCASNSSCIRKKPVNPVKHTTKNFII